MVKELAKHIGLLVLVIVLIAIILTLFDAWPSWQPQNPAPTTSQTRQTPAPPSAQVLQQLAQNPTFQYLISYTDKGFQPNVLKIKEGQTVRFTNNSTQSLWVASIGSASSQIYPGTSTCGGSTFDSCETLKPGDFWEFTFTTPGTWSFQNNVDKTYGGTITVSR